MAYDSDGDLVYMEVNFISPPGQVVPGAGGWGVYDPYATGYWPQCYASEAGHWYARARALDAEGNYQEGYESVWVN